MTWLRPGKNGSITGSRRGCSTCGSAAFGGGIFFSEQIFHLSTHWPGGLLLWAVGAWLGWALLRDWPRALLAALLTPAWLVGEWTAAAGRHVGGPALTV